MGSNYEEFKRLYYVFEHDREAPNINGKKLQEIVAERGYDFWGESALGIEREALDSKGVLGENTCKDEMGGTDYSLYIMQTDEGYEFWVDANEFSISIEHCKDGKTKISMMGKDKKDKKIVLEGEEIVLEGKKIVLEGEEDVSDVKTINLECSLDSSWFTTKDIFDGLIKKYSDFKYIVEMLKICKQMYMDMLEISREFEPLSGLSDIEAQNKLQEIEERNQQIEQEIEKAKKLIAELLVQIDEGKKLSRMIEAERERGKVGFGGDGEHE